MAKSSRQGQVLLETLLFIFFCLAIVNIFKHYEDTLKNKQKNYRWEQKRHESKRDH